MTINEKVKTSLSKAGASNNNVVEIPTIDLSLPDNVIVPLIADACETFGYFQCIHHGIEETMIDDFRRQMTLLFHDLGLDEKQALKRHESNARGYMNDELTKQRLDWKEAWDVGVPGSRDWSIADEDPANECLDGINVFPSSLGHDFRSILVNYFQACTNLSQRLAILMARGLLSQQQNNNKNDMSNETSTFLQHLADYHTSYLRLNHYPPKTNNNDGSPVVAAATSTNDNDNNDDTPPLGISPHRDAGFLTILLQDDDCHSLQVWKDDKWITIHPLPYSLTINTGDMCMIWSNGRYQAPLHRVLTHDSLERYSAPFFYNPGYTTLVKPCSNEPTNNQQNDDDRNQPKYNPCLWGYFRAVRFAGDLTDLGVEIQTEDYQVVNGNTKQMEKQRIFAERADFTKPFSVETYRDLLSG